MAEPLRCVSPESIIVGWDFGTGSTRCLAFTLDGNIVAELRYATQLYTEGGVSELDLSHLQQQAQTSVRDMAARLRALGRLKDWVAGGISATHHTSGRIDAERNQVRRAICWNDPTLAPHHQRGLARLGGQERVKHLTGGPWAIRYTLSHLVKDEATLDPADWKRTDLITQHGALAAGYLTGNFGVVSVSAAASTGMMDLRTCQWCRPMLNALEKQEYQDLAWEQLPLIIEQDQPIGRLSASLAQEAGIDPEGAPWIFPTSDDQQAGLVGGGAVDEGQMAVILGTSAVVNSSSPHLPTSGHLDAMRLNWGPYLWMRCYNNGAQFLNRIVGEKPDWDRLEQEARACPPGSEGIGLLPFAHPEPSLGVARERLQWLPEGTDPSRLPAGKKFRASLEALAYLIARGVREHEDAGQKITRITVSGGIARSQLMCEILATVLRRPLARLQSDEGPALGAAVTALAALETYQRRQQEVRGQRSEVRGQKSEVRSQNLIEAPFTVADAVAALVKFREEVAPNPAWIAVYQKGQEVFEQRIREK